MRDIDKIILQDLKEIRKDIKEISKEMGLLKVKVATFSTIFGVIGAYIKVKFFGN